MEQFQQTNPGVKVTVTLIPWDAAHNKFTTAITAQTLPDAAMVGTTWMGEFADLGALDPTPQGISLFDWPVFGERSFLGLGNYSHLLHDAVFRRVVLNTALFVVLYVPLNVVVSLGLAVWLGPRIKGRQAFRVLFFIPVMTPMVANVMVWRLLFQPGGLIDSGMQTWFGIDAPNFLGSSSWAMPAIVAMSIWQGFGYNFLVFSAALDQVPQSQLESAQLDGAGGLQRFRYVVWPMITPSIFFATTMTLITSFQVFPQPFILTQGGPGVSTQTIVMYVYNQGWQFLSMGLASAAGWVLFVIIMGITAIQFAGATQVGEL